MNKAIFTAALLLLGSQTFAAITIATVPVGNPGNANDPATGNLYGGVNYNYSIGEYDVTVGQYATFLNAVAATDAYSLYNPLMGTDLNIAGISRSGSSGSFTYNVVGSANHPITYVNWGDSARFANWLYNGQPTIGGEGNGTTESGSYTLNGATTDTQLNVVMRNTNATWVIPTENEWYKAAYYNPATSSYYQYPFSSSTVPISAPPGNTPNTGNFLSSSGVYPLTGSTSLSSNQNYLTDVGTYTASASPYGAYDMGGDVFQWNETLFGGSFRNLGGGAWDSLSEKLSSSERNGFDPTREFDILGFRVALVPEPASCSLALLAFGGLVALAARRC